MDVDVVDAPESSRYEARNGSEVAGYAEYRDLDQVRVFTHTVVEAKYEGEGVGSTLIRGALDDTRGLGMRIQPDCQFVQEFLKKHEDYQDLVASG